jgi:hypothetical protein
MARIVDWLKTRLGLEEPEPEEPLWQSGVHARPRPARRPQSKPRSTSNRAPIDFSSDLGGKIIDGGPGKNVLIRNKYVREENGTHETLKIVDDGLLESREEPGADPYNTGRFDRSQSWDSFRTRK